MKYVAHLIIRFYQRFISPYKGFRCAHATLHKGDSCSEAVRKIVMEQGVFKGYKSVKARFNDCTAAYQILLSEQEDKKDKRKKRKRDKLKECMGDSCEQGGIDCAISSCKFPFKKCDIDLPCDCSLF